MQEAAIKIEDLSVHYGKKQVIKGLNLQVPTGSIFGFLGANGAGKTTTIKTLLGFRRPSGGQAYILGYDIRTQRIEMNARIGYVSQSQSFYRAMNVPQLCNLCRRMNHHWNQNLVNHYLDMFEVPRTKKMKHFSEGMKSQVALSLAIGNEPDLLILDEPTSGLDPVARQLFLQVLVSEVAAAGKTIFFSSHILSEVEMIADHVAVIYDGKIVFSDELDHLRATQKIVRLTYTEALPPEELTFLRNLAGVFKLDQEGRVVRLLVNRPVEGLLDTLKNRPYTLRDVEMLDAQPGTFLLEYIKGVQQ